MSDLEKKLRDHNLLVNKKKTGTYQVVYPTPGCVIKFKKARMMFSPQGDEHKCFVNVAHCLEVPEPEIDVDEAEMIKMMRVKADTEFVLPLSLGDLECVKDKQDENSLKFDVVINSDFYHKRFTKSEFHKQLTIAAFIDKIEQEHQVRITRSSQTILKNKKVFGELSMHAIPKTMRREPKKPQIIDLTDMKRPLDMNPQENVQIWSEHGQILKMRIYVKGGGVTADQLRLQANNDHVVLLQKGGKRIADFYVPVDIDVNGLIAQIVEPDKDDDKNTFKHTCVELSCKCIFP